MGSKTGFDALMEDICGRLGFCGSVIDGKPLHVTMFIPEEGPVTADQFAEWVFLAEGMDPNADLSKGRRLQDKIRAAFVARMGAESADARLLRWG